MSQSNDRTLIAALCIVFGATLLGAQAHPHYRTYRMGDDILAVSQQLGVPVPAASQQGGTVRELRWRADYAARGTEAADPVERLMFRPLQSSDSEGSISPGARMPAET